VKVVFLALGATRRPMVISESARVVAEGGTATILIERRSSWADDSFPGGVEIVELRELVRRYRPDAVTRWLFRFPERFFRACAPGPLRRGGDRLYRAFRWRVARPLDKRLARRYRSDAAAVRRKALRQAVLSGARPDLVVVADAASMAPAAALASKGPGRALDLAFYGPVGAATSEPATGVRD